MNRHYRTILCQRSRWFRFEHNRFKPDGGSQGIEIALEPERRR